MRKNTYQTRKNFSNFYLKTPVRFLFKIASKYVERFVLGTLKFDDAILVTQNYD